MTQSRRARKRRTGHAARYIAAAASIAAAQIHVVMAPVHAGEWPASGAFFVLLGVLQALWGMAVLRWSDPLLLGAGAAVNAGTLGLWGFSRIFGMPFGPHAGVPEAVGTTGLVAAALEGVLILAVAAALLWRTARPEPGAVTMGVAA
ncbi:hypothetical protein ACFQZ2_24250, partial [Streptomonospora algeriensis]